MRKAVWNVLGRTVLEARLLGRTRCTMKYDNYGTDDSLRRSSSEET